MTLNINTFSHVEEALKLIPPNAPVAVVMRHAERGQFAVGHHGNDILLTPQGEQDSLNMGILMKGRIAQLFHSPVPRCLQTAKQICIGSEMEINPSKWMALRCDVFVDDFDLALNTLGRLVSELEFYDIFVEHMSTCGNNIPYPHFRPPLLAVAEMIGHLLTRKGEKMCIGITHDWLINVAVSYVTGKAIKRENYAGFLNALFVWKEKETLMFYYKGETGACSPLLADLI